MFLWCFYCWHTFQRNKNGSKAFIPAEGDGSYHFVVQATDLAGNSQALPSGNGEATTIYDTTGPTVSLEVEATADPNIFTISWSPGNGETDIASYTVQYRDVLGQWLDWTNPSGSAFTGEPGHTYVFRAQATDNVGIPGEWTTSEPLITERAITKYYSHGGYRVAMRKDGTVYYLHGDHLGSTSLTTDASGDIIAESRYHPFGEERWSSGAGVTDFAFNAQRAESGFGLQDFNARYFSPKIGRFLTPDSIVPDYSNPQDLNRYSYVRNNPLNYVDPSGHDPQSPGDPDPNDAPCSTDWCWQNRWYEAHGAGWNGMGWTNDGRDAHFYDPQILLDVLAENGIGAVGNWDFGELSLLGQGVVALSNKVGGAASLNALLGSQWTKFKRGGQGTSCSPTACQVGSTITFFNDLFNITDLDYIRATAVHELAHVIDWASFGPLGGVHPGGVASVQITTYSGIFPQTAYVSKYAQEPGLFHNAEYFAEAVALWVYGARYKTPVGKGYAAGINPFQTTWLTSYLVR